MIEETQSEKRDTVKAVSLDENDSTLTCTTRDLWVAKLN